ncbi:class I SAM-dependent methyltransferase [Pelagibius sp. Alg239-R121]|uniref:class I SAM-dependent methyltransferase n=1 Tax=Pelagibius sp. Alg239-R121 TaxID=2993448 RepID=UPI0024A67DD6|nr:class I SAM-dependent methyltransferase [Pelagibius sp. Alg239-R121]
MVTAESFWDKTAERYAKSPVKDMAAYEQTLDRTRAWLLPGDRMLEVGCGTGTTALLLAEKVQEITASDISASMIEIARGKAVDQGVSNVNFRQGTLEGSPLDGGSLGEGPYDVVTAYNFLHLLEDPAAAVARVRGLLKPEGLFISKTVCLAGFSFWKRLLVKLLIPVMQLVGKAPYVRFMSVNDVERCMTEAGFEILETGDYPASPPCRFVVARKR